ncbi:diguanylate cyclase (GGDEF)-like protein [Sporosarcina luteola]|nr:diguanylate cyclase (GGDEF)-like protein [Sporosarcina luteola]
MNPDIFSYLVITSISGVLSLFLAIYAFSKRNAFSSSSIFIWMSLFSVIYIFGHAFELTSSNLAESIFWLKVQYVGMPFISPLALLLSLRFAGVERMRRPRYFMPLLLLPALTSIFCLTNEWHHFMYRDIYLRPNESQPLIDMTPGPWYIVHGSFTFGCLLFGAVILIRYWAKTRARYWKQILTMIAGLIIPMVASFLYLMGLSPHGMDPVPIVMCFTSALYLIAILSTTLFVAPIARDRIFESMRDGVLVIDSTNRLVDYNQAALATLTTLQTSSIGKDIVDIWDTNTLGPIPFHTESETPETNGHYYRICPTPVLDRKGQQIGLAIVIIDTTKQKMLEKRLTQLAYTDGMTQISNRSSLMYHSEKALKHALLQNHPLSLLLFDIDLFKGINDQYGHAVGDEAIRHVVSIAERHVRPTDIFGRYGGEEFVICLPTMPLVEASQVAEQIRKDIEQNPLRFKEFELQITASFGVSSFHEKAQSIDALLNEADQALYASKAAGRNIVHVAHQNNLVPFRLTRGDDK